MGLGVRVRVGVRFRDRVSLREDNRPHVASAPGESRPFSRRKRRRARGGLIQEEEEEREPAFFKKKKRENG